MNETKYLFDRIARPDPHSSPTTPIRAEASLNPAAGGVFYRPPPITYHLSTVQSV